MGIEGNPITLKGDGWGEGKAIIDGSEPLTGWVKCRSSAECGGNENWANIWVTTVPSEWRTGENRAITLNPYQGEKMMSAAQYPDQPNPFYFDDTDYFADADNYTATWLEDDALAGMNLTGSYLVLWGGNNNALIRTPTSFDPLTNRVTYEEIINPYGKYSILNSIDSEVFNRPGEFYYDETSSKLYVWPLDGANPNHEEITISVRSNGIAFWNGNDYVAVSEKSTNVNTANNIIIDNGLGPQTENMDLYLKAKPATDMSTLFHKSPIINAPLEDVHKFDSLENVSVIYLADHGYENIIEPGHFLRYDRRSVHQITEVSRVNYKGNWRTRLVLDTPVAMVMEKAYIEVWKTKDDFTIDYHLFDGSIAVDKGIDISGLIPAEKFPLYDFSKDLDGSPRAGKWDIGPLEYDHH